MVKRIISVFGVLVILFSSCLSVYADIVDSGSYIASNFWDFLSGNEFDYNLDFWNNVTGYFVGKECPSSPDSYHHGPKPAFGSSSGGSDENGRFSWATCEYCGNQFKVYSSFSGGSGFGKSDLQQSYDAQVAELPATGYQSDGSLLWSPKISYIRLCYLNSWSGNKYYSCPHYTGDDTSTLSISPTFDCANRAFSIRPVTGSESFAFTDLFLSFSDILPIDGYYTRISSLGVSVSYVYTRNGISKTSSCESSYLADNNSILHYAGIGFSYSCYLKLSFSSSINYVSAKYYPVVYKIVPFNPSDVPNTTYNINSRPTSITGDYGIIGDNGQIIKVEGDKIVNETNNTYYNPSTGQTVPITDWSYNYEDRSYTVTTESGDTVTITYGDENVVIKEGGTTYNIYYLVNGSGSEDPGPEVCDHTWTETSRTDPTCSTPGKVTSTCSKCNQTKTETIPATGHSWVVDRTVQTTYDEEGNLLQQGYTIYSCSVCGEQYKDMEGTGPPGAEGEKSIWEKLGDLIGSGFGGIIEIIEAILGKILDALTSLVDMLMGQLKHIVESILSIFDELPALFGGFLDFLAAIFPFLPPEITTILTFGVIAITFIGILKAVRR